MILKAKPCSALRLNLRMMPSVTVLIDPGSNSISTEGAEMAEGPREDDVSSAGDGV